ncbi:MAG: DUF4349 domain-containing protein [Phycicoccus sp.]|nr:DUF4349 domain-containing protein [Phycicoccus sp.]NMM35638.1 DUF4349 domain-containing protein [Phycicoccus sp.]
MKITFPLSKSRCHASQTYGTGPHLPRGKMIAAGALTALLLAGCSSGSTSDSNPASAGGGVAARDSLQSAPEAKSFAVAPGAPADASKPGSAAVSVGPKLTKSASLELRVKDISVAAAQVRSIATGLQAQVLNEQIGTGGPGDPVPLSGDQRSSSQPADAFGFGTLTLSVPADQLDAALDQLGKIGTVLSRNTSSQDVTSQYVDTESRLKTMRASVDRVRALMAQAKDIGQVVALESEMSRRQADLESLESQLTALKGSVERSTLAVSLRTPGNETVTENGFLAGLRSGWDAFAASAEGLFTGIGAVLPFAVFFALIGSPLVWWLRRRRRTSSPAQVNN